LIGGGSGVSVEFFKCTIFGLDPARELLRRNKSNVVHGRGESLPFKDHSVDIILCLTALHNFSDPFKGLEEMRRVCRDRFIITVLKKSVNAERTENICKAIKTMFKVEKELDDLHDYIYLCRHLDK
jgi:ubiquinone/menaquinone biosynthesis C-methylase UbiE